MAKDTITNISSELVELENDLFILNDFRELLAGDDSSKEEIASFEEKVKNLEKEITNKKVQLEFLEEASI